MTWLLWWVAIVGVLLITAVGLRIIGARQWVDLIRTHTGQLELARVDGEGRPAFPARYDVRELQGLPAPVQRYFRAVLENGQPIIAAVTIEMAGTVSGESDVSTNPQVRTLDASVPRYRAWRGRVGATVALGDWLGLVGNSDNSAELHLHAHAQRPGPAGAPLGGDPLPILFNGRFPVRGDRIESP
jgi:hypothetical protein